MPWGWSVVLGFVSAALTSAGAVPLIKGLLERRLTEAAVEIKRVTAVDTLSDTALDMLRQAKADAEDARMEARDARREANEARREAVEARIEAMRAAASMRSMIDAILNPYATVEELRKMVQREGI
jgi:hypothetical protein